MSSRGLPGGALHWTRYKIKAPAANATKGTQKWMSWKIGLSQDLICGSLLRYGIFRLRTTRGQQARLVAAIESRPKRTPRSNRLGLSVYTSARSAVNLFRSRVGNMSLLANHPAVASVSLPPENTHVVPKTKLNLRKGIRSAIKRGTPSFAAPVLCCIAPPPHEDWYVRQVNFCGAEIPENCRIR